MNSLPGTTRAFSMWFSCLLLLVGATSLQAQTRWRQHDMARPRPVVVQPAAEQPSLPPPSDAIVLFDGGDLAQWQQPGGQPSRWTVVDGAMLPTPNSGMIETKRSFGSIQLHLEFQTPSPTHGKGQERGNSGVYFMGLYELQVLDSYENQTYADGQAAAIYGQHPPLVNVSLPPATWQNYDVVFHAPTFHEDGSLSSPATMTAFHNGVLVQDHFALTGRTMWLQTLPYAPHPDTLPLSLQDHGNPVKFRNIWVRPLADAEDTPPRDRAVSKTVADDPALALSVGKYRMPSGQLVELKLESGRLQARLFDQLFHLRRTSEHSFQAEETDISFSFSPDRQELTCVMMEHSPETGVRVAP